MGPLPQNRAIPTLNLHPDPGIKRGRAWVSLEGGIGKCLGLGDANAVDNGYP